MKTNTYEERLKAAAEKAANRTEFDHMVEEIMRDIFATDNRLWSLNRRWSGYGTWTVTMFTNNYAWGEELTEYIDNNFKITTHDEDKEYNTLQSVEDELREVVENYAFELY